MSLTPYYDIIQRHKEPKDNLRWRIKLREAALHDQDLQHTLYDACMSDVLFWLNWACSLYEPRAACKVIPFCTWPHQDAAVLAMDDAITEAERTGKPIALTLKKSRAQGATWMYLCLDIRRWLRDPMYSVGYVTRNEDSVDSSTNQDTLLWKVAWELEHIPKWMLPAGFSMKLHRSLTDHSFFNPANGATIVGYSASADVARGGRKTVFRCDEIGSEEFIAGGKDFRVLSSISHVTNCITLVSTFGGDSGVFHESATDVDNKRVLTLDWKDNPTQNQLSYVFREGIAVAVKPDEQADVTEYVKTNAANIKRLERKGHKLEGKVRSPVYDSYCLLPGATPRFIAREMDMDPRGAVGKVFDINVLDRMKKDVCQPPVWQGKPIYDEETLTLKGLIAQENGPLKLWFKPGLNYVAPLGNFCVGCDLSSGGDGDYSSNSTAEGINKGTGELVLEYAVKGVFGTKFARVAVVLARWLRDAYLGWEDSGVAGAFAKEVVEVIAYPNVYYRDVDDIGIKRKTRKLGWWNGNSDDKGTLFENLCIAMEDGSFLPRSEDLIRECGEYEWENGKIVHRPSKDSGIDVKAHGDRCVGAGVAYLLCEDRPEKRLDEEETLLQNPPYGSWAWREKQDNKDKRDEQSPQFTINDLLNLRS